MRKLRILSIVVLACAYALGHQDQATGPAPGGAPAAPALSDGKNPNALSQEATEQGSQSRVPQPDLTPDANGRLSQQQMQQLFRVVAEKDIENNKRQHDYTYVEREIEKKLDGKGQIKSTEVKTYEILEIYREQVQRLIEKDDKPLSEKDAAKEEEKIQKIIDKRKTETEDERKKREQREEKDREEGREFVRDAADAYDFKLVGTELLDGREVWVIEGEPRPGFVPHAKGGKYLSKFHGRVWIDKADLQVVKLDVQCLDTISWGLFLARFHKGSRFMLEQTRVNDEVWLPRHVTFKLDARLALLKGFNIEGEQTYRDYKKFRTSAKMVSVEDVKSKSP